MEGFVPDNSPPVTRWEDDQFWYLATEEQQDAYWALPKIDWYPGKFAGQAIKGATKPAEDAFKKFAETMKKVLIVVAIIATIGIILFVVVRKFILKRAVTAMGQAGPMLSMIPIPQAQVAGRAMTMIAGMAGGG